MVGWMGDALPARHGRPVSEADSPSQDRYPSMFYLSLFNFASFLIVMEFQSYKSLARDQDGENHS
jgi:hypothetical protein